MRNKGGFMTYQEIFDLKYNQGFSTYELVQRFPQEVARISEVALLEIPEDTLREVIAESEVLDRLMNLKKKYGQEKLGSTREGR